MNAIPADRDSDEHAREETQAVPPSKPSIPALPKSATPVLPKIVSFSSIAPCGDEIWIENEGQIYRLRRTRQGKLILTK